MGAHPAPRGKLIRCLDLGSRLSDGLRESFAFSDEGKQSRQKVCYLCTKSYERESRNHGL